MAKLLFFLALYLAAFSMQAQMRPDSTRVVVLRDVAVSDKIVRLVVTSGAPRRDFFHTISPGGAAAVHFSAPRGGYHQLSRVRVHLHAPGSIKEGQLRVRVASITTDGSPADDDMLPTPTLLTTADLQHAHHTLTLSWPANRLVVPENGFFIVLEGYGNYPDEYVSKLIPPALPKQPGRYEISRRDQPAQSPRLVDFLSFPELAGAAPLNNEAEYWYRDTRTRAWHLGNNRSSVVFVEALFE